MNANCESDVLIRRKSFMFVIEWLISEAPVLDVGSCIICRLCNVLRNFGARYPSVASRNSHLSLCNNKFVAFSFRCAHKYLPPTK